MKLWEFLRIQGGYYYVASGLFPLVSMELFERLTGPKRDRWLVQMVGLQRHFADILGGCGTGNHTTSHAWKELLPMSKLD